MTSTEMVFATSSLKDRMDWARAIAGAGQLVPAGFRDGNNANPAKILLAVEYGAMLGLHPMAALSGIHVIDGKPTLSAALMSALVHKAGHKLRITNTGSVTATGRDGKDLGGDFTVTAILIRSDDTQHPFTVTWTIDRAKRAGLWNRGNWAKYPENQMTWRAVSEATKLGAPEVLSGVWYTPDELGAAVDEDGDIIDGGIVEQDHDGPNVVAAMREPKPGTPGDRLNSGHSNETRVEAASDREPTAQAPKAPARGRKPSATTPGNPDLDENGRADVAQTWISRIQGASNMTALIALRDEVVKRGSVILDYEDYDAHTVDQWFNRRRAELQQAQAGEPDTHLSETVDYPEDSDVPF